MTLSPFPGHGPARKGDNLASLPVPSARTTLAHLFEHETRVDDLSLSHRGVGRAQRTRALETSVPVRFLSQSVAVLLPRADTRGLSCPLSARLGFNSVGPFKAARRLLPVRLHSASRVRQNPTPRTIEQLFHLLSFLPCYVSKHSQGANAACAKNLSRRCKQ